MLRTHDLDVEILQRELERKDRELKLIADISAMIGRVQPLRSVLDAIAERVAGLLSTPCCAILLLTLDGRQITIEGAAGLNAAYIAMVNRYGIADHDLAVLPSVSVCRSGKSMIWDDLLGDPMLAHLHEAQRRQGLRSMIAVPLFGPQGVIGTLNCYHTQPCHFDADDQAVLTMIGNHAAAAITNARLIDQLNASVRRLSEMNEVVQRQHTILRRSDTIHRQLTTLVLEEPGLEAVIATLARLLRCGVSLYDPLWRLLSCTPPPTPGDPEAAVLDARVLAAGEVLPRQRTITRIPVAYAPGVAAAVCPIIARDQTLGYLVVPEAIAFSGEIEQRAIEHAAVVCARELLHQRLVQEVERRQMGALLDTLLTEQRISTADIQRQAEHLGLQLERNVRMLLIALDPGASDALDGAMQLHMLVAAELRQYCPQALLALRGAHTLALLVGACACEPAELCVQIQAAARSLPGTTVRIALSGLAERPEDLARAYAEVKETLSVLQHLEAGNQVLSYDDLGVCGLIIRSAGRDDLVRLAQRWVGPLVEYQQRRSIDLLATLECHLRLGCSPQRTAKALFVHPNTVKHRLNLISELVQADLSDTRVLLDVQLALLVWRLVRVDREPFVRQAVG